MTSVKYHDTAGTLTLLDLHHVDTKNHPSACNSTASRWQRTTASTRCRSLARQATRWCPRRQAGDASHHRPLVRAPQGRGDGCRSCSAAHGRALPHGQVQTPNPLTWSRDVLTAASSSSRPATAPTGGAGHQAVGRPGHGGAAVKDMGAGEREELDQRVTVRRRRTPSVQQLRDDAAPRQGRPGLLLHHQRGKDWTRRGSRLDSRSPRQRLNHGHPFRHSSEAPRRSASARRTSRSTSRRWQLSTLTS